MRKSTPPIAGVKATQSKPAAPAKPIRWTLALMEKVAKENDGVCFVKGKGRKFDHRLHPGKDGIYFVFTQKHCKGFRVRMFDCKDGRTTHRGTRVYATRRNAHLAASLLAKLPHEIY